MQYIGLILLLFSFVFFCISWSQAGAPQWNKLISLGLAFFTAALIFGDAARLSLFGGH